MAYHENFLLNSFRFHVLPGQKLLQTETQLRWNRFQMCTSQEKKITWLSTALHILTAISKQLFSHMYWDFNIDVCICSICASSSNFFSFFFSFFFSSWLFVMLTLMCAFIVLVLFLIVKWILMLIMNSAASSWIFTVYSTIYTSYY